MLTLDTLSQGRMVRIPAWWMVPQCRCQRRSTRWQQAAPVMMRSLNSLLQQTKWLDSGIWWRKCTWVKTSRRRSIRTMKQPSWSRWTAAHCPTSRGILKEGSWPAGTRLRMVRLFQSISQQCIWSRTLEQKRLETNSLHTFATCWLDILWSRLIIPPMLCLPTLCKEWGVSTWSDDGRNDAQLEARWR